ncbi:MAG: hypothetical protein HYZ53_27260 [Planctomycetes bacterium]|nr:hypothetical protein [Planctomycetota bacterium]
MGNYLTLYVSRYGTDRHYPTTIALGGSGAPVPAGPNGAFWSWLYRVPNQTNAVSQRPGDDGIYVCKTSGTQPTTSALEYTGPSLGATWPEGEHAGQALFPGGTLSSAVGADTPIGGDLVFGVAQANHGQSAPDRPNDDWACLFFDGHVERILPDTQKAKLYRAATTGERTT